MNGQVREIFKCGLLNIEQGMHVYCFNMELLKIKTSDISCYSEKGGVSRDYLPAYSGKALCRIFIFKKKKIA